MEITAKYLNEVMVANITGRALSTLRNERAKGKGIPYIKIGRSVRYDLVDVIRFMSAHKIITQDVIYDEDRELNSGHERCADVTCAFCRITTNHQQKEVAGKKI